MIVWLRLSTPSARQRGQCQGRKTYKNSIAVDENIGADDKIKLLTYRL